MTLKDFYYWMVFANLHISPEELMWWYRELKADGLSLNEIERSK